MQRKANRVDLDIFQLADLLIFRIQFNLWFLHFSERHSSQKSELVDSRRTKRETGLEDGLISIYLLNNNQSLLIVAFFLLALSNEIAAWLHLKNN